MDTIKVRRENVVLSIFPHEKDDYMSRGFSVIDADGNIIEEALPTDVQQLQKMVLDLRIQLAEAKQVVEKKQQQTKRKTED